MFNDSMRASSDVTIARGYIVTQDEILLQRESNETREKDLAMTPRGDVRFFSDRNTFSFSLPFSFSLFPLNGRCPSLVKGGREARIGRKGKPDIGDRAAPSLFGRVSNMVWRVPKGIDGGPPCLPYAISPRFWCKSGSVTAMRAPLLTLATASIPIEITLIYCGIERLARSIIRLSQLGSRSKVFGIFSDRQWIDPP